MNAKQLAAEEAVTHIEDGMIVGLGTGSTSYFAILGLAARMKEGLRIQAVASSQGSEDLARQLGIPILPFSDIEAIDVTIDGADEVDENFNLIKGGGGALLREKILAANSRKFIVIVDDSKLVRRLGAFSLPVEIIPFAYELTMRNLAALDCKPTLRSSEGKPFVTDNGNYIADCAFGVIESPAELSNRLKSIPGVVEHGLFVKMTETVIVGSGEGTIAYL
ncbi:ribose-5-phosphate isomerase RpiA [Paenibacillus glycinis]|uniref:Ribose-5-phosphate isomerase A n=1 Tax=Paenibacillus glycinis TaxID=2697035 RepID=A0ABW9Y170_9BACL|nr:ribose-5-phosphate isomerase RpiA [Paenibacillus glycinis]NBD28199.1 ribose-5-phosphate isomerase RpiA [Paenibacillus glycinis]